MKTIKVCMLICSLLVLSNISCDNDDGKDELDAVYLESELHLWYLEKQKFQLEERIIVISELLFNDQNNGELIEEYDEIKSSLEKNQQFTGYMAQFNSELRSEIPIDIPGFPPVPCPISSCIPNLLLGKTRILTRPGLLDFNITVNDTESVENKDDGNGADDLCQLLDCNIINLDKSGLYVIKVTKFFEPIGDVFTYEVIVSVK